MITMKGQPRKDFFEQCLTDYPVLFLKKYGRIFSNTNEPECKARFGNFEKEVSFNIIYSSAPTLRSLVQKTPNARQ